MAKTVALHLPGDMGIIVFGLLIGTAVYTAFKVGITLFQVYRFRQLVTKSVVSMVAYTPLITKMKLAGEVVFLQEDKPYAYCFGIRSPKIFLTTGLLALVNKKELEIILRHEKYHLDHQDNLVLLFATVIKSLFPFFPILTDLVRMYKTDRELLADRAAIQNDDDKTTLSSVLKKLLVYSPATLPTFAPAIADTDTLEVRIRTLCALRVTTPTLRKSNIISSLFFALMLIALMRTPVNAVELHKNGVDAVLVCNEDVSCESVCADRNSVQQLTSVSKNFSTSN